MTFLFKKTPIPCWDYLLGSFSWQKPKRSQEVHCFQKVYLQIIKTLSLFILPQFKSFFSYFWSDYDHKFSVENELRYTCKRGTGSCADISVNTSYIQVSPLASGQFDMSGYASLVSCSRSGTLKDEKPVVSKTWYLVKSAP